MSSFFSCSSVWSTVFSSWRVVAFVTFPMVTVTAPPPLPGPFPFLVEGLILIIPLLSIPFPIIAFGAFDGVGAFVFFNLGALVGVGAFVFIIFGAFVGVGAFVFFTFGALVFIIFGALVGATAFIVGAKVGAFVGFSLGS
jgi:hypothetical protein